MKMRLTILSLLFATQVFPQNQLVPINKKDRLLSCQDPATLSYLLTDGCNNEKEKVKAIFYWITENIAYYRPEIKNPSRKNRSGSLSADEQPDDLPLPSLTDRVAAKVMHDRKAVCEGYARLFKSVCDYACIPSVIITGYARTNMNRSESKFRSNHSWNAVYFDSVWHLLDATWASGYISGNTGEFVRYYDDYYFLTPPEQFIRHHYPDDLRWTLLDEAPPLTEFRNTPYRQRSFNKYGITAYSPSRGIIEAAVGDTIRLTLEIDPYHYAGSVLPDSLWDTDNIPVAPSYAYVKPGNNNTSSNKIVYSFPVDSESIQWLHVMYNDDAVLRYKLNIRKSKETAPVSKN